MSQIPPDRQFVENDRASGSRKLLSPKWLVGHLLALGLIVLFFNFGVWQLRRLEQRQASNQLIAERMEAEPRDLSELLEGELPVGSLDFRRTLARGRFDQESELLLRSRSREGQPGWHLLTPLVQDDGRAVLVDRGWVPIGFDTPPVDEAAPPPGEVVVEGLVRLEQDPPQGWAAGLAPRDPPEGELESAYYVDVERLSPQFRYPLEPVYLQLERVEPPTPGELPLAPEPPELEQGTHLSYALQWFSFALIGLVGYSILLWRTAKEQ